MKRIVRVTVVFLMIALPSLAQVADSASAAPATRDDILKLFDTMHIRDQMRLVMDSVAKQQREMIREGLKKRAPQMTEQDLAASTSSQATY